MFEEKNLKKIIAEKVNENARTGDDLEIKFDENLVYANY